MKWTRALAAPVAGLTALAAYDLLQKKHALLRNFPVVAHLRYLLEEVVPATAVHTGENVAIPAAKVLGGPRDRRHKWCGDDRVPAQHRRGRVVAVPPARRGPGPADRYGVLRLP